MSCSTPDTVGADCREMIFIIFDFWRQKTAAQGAVPHIPPICSSA